MATWKKVIVSGSNAHLNHITSSGDISASGNLFGNLPEDTNELNVVVYNPTTGQLEYKELNLISTTAAPRLFLADQVNSDSTVANFKLSYDTGSSAVGGGVVPYTRLSASAETPGTYDVLPSNNLSWKGINDQWDAEVDNGGNSGTTFYEGATNTTGSVLGSRNGLIKGESAQTPITISLNAVDNNSNAVPSYNSAESNFNYLAKSFNDGGIGELRIYANDNEIDSPARTIDLESSFDAITGTVSGITIDLSPTRSNADGTTGDPDPTKHARSGSFTVGTSLQNDGYNYAYALHTGSKDGTDFAYITNFVEWFYDEAGAAADLSIPDDLSELSEGTFTANQTESISGIKYFNTTAGNNTYFKYTTRCINQYKNIYPTSNTAIIFDVLSDSNNVISEVQITQSGQYVDTNDSNHKVSDTGISNGASNLFYLAELQNIANANTNDTEITASVKIDFPSGEFHQPSDFITTPWGDLSNECDASFNIQFNHITTNGSHKDIDTATTSNITVDDYLVNTLNESANESEFEDFKRETYRIQSKSYSATDTIDSSTHEWDGEKNIINGGSGFNKNNIQYVSHLCYPTGAGDYGVFTTGLGPANQPNYSTATGEREYFRYFKLLAGQAGQKTFNIELLGGGKIVTEDHTAHFGAGDNDAIKVYIWRSGGTTNSIFRGTFRNVMENVGIAGYSGNTITDEEVHYIPLNASSVSYQFLEEPANDDVTFRRGVAKFKDVASASNSAEDEFIIVRIVTPEDWTGYIDAMALTVGDPTDTNGRLIGEDYTGTQL